MRGCCEPAVHLPSRIALTMPSVATHDPTDPETLETRSEARAERARQAAQHEIEDLKWLMSSKRGRRIVWRLLEQAGVFRLSFNPNAMQMAFAEGNRNAGLRTLAQIHASCPDLFPLMLKEQSGDDRNLSDDGSAQSKRR